MVLNCFSCLLCFPLPGRFPSQTTPQFLMLKEKSNFGISLSIIKKKQRPHTTQKSCSISSWWVKANWALISSNVLPHCLGKERIQETSRARNVILLLCLLLVRPTWNSVSSSGASNVMRTETLEQDAQRLEYLSYEDTLRQLVLFSLEKRRFQGNLTAAL